MSSVESTRKLPIGNPKQADPEMLFNLEAPEGSRGGEGCIILAVQPEKMLAFTA